MPTPTTESGKLRHRVEFWSQNATQVEGGQKIETPAVVMSDVPARVENYAGDESRRGEQVVADATHLVTTRFFNELETRPDMYILQPKYPPGLGAAKRLNILRTVDEDGERRWLKHYCKEEVLASG